MKFSLVSALALPLFASAASVTHTVQVGQGGLTFSPNSIKAAKGDKIAFHFASGGHTVAQGNFKAGCQPGAPAPFFSGSGPSGKTWTIVVNSTEPTPFYCSTPGHCQNGMSGVINPSTSQSVADYKALASKSTNSKAPPKVRGGKFSG